MAGRAIGLHAADRYAVQLQRLSQRQAGHSDPVGADRAQPGRLNLSRVDAGILVRLVSGFDHHIIAPLLPVLAELATSHAHYGYFVLNAFHIPPPISKLWPAGI